MIVFYFGHKIVRKTKLIPLADIPVGSFIALADANPEPEMTVKKGPVSWFTKFWWD
jgi:hypothetical protein